MDTKLNQILGGLGTLVPGGRRVQVYVNHHLAGGDTWTQSVLLPFKPRQCIVRQAVYHSDPAQPDLVFLLRGLSLDNSVLAILPVNNVPVDPGIVLDLTGKFVGPTLHFQLQELNGEAAGPPAADERVVCILEFVE